MCLLYNQFILTDKIMVSTSNTTRLIVLIENGSFDDTTASLFNSLLNDIKNCSDYYIFICKLHKFLTLHALS